MTTLNGDRELILPHLRRLIRLNGGSSRCLLLLHERVRSPDLRKVLRLAARSRSVQADELRGILRPMGIERGLAQWTTNLLNRWRLGISEWQHAQEGQRVLTFTDGIEARIAAAYKGVLRTHTEQQLVDPLETADTLRAMLLRQAPHTRRVRSHLQEVCDRFSRTVDRNSSVDGDGALDRNAGESAGSSWSDSAVTLGLLDGTASIDLEPLPGGDEPWLVPPPERFRAHGR